MISQCAKSQTNLLPPTLSSAVSPIEYESVGPTNLTGASTTQDSREHINKP